MMARIRYSYHALVVLTWLLVSARTCYADATNNNNESINANATSRQLASSSRIVGGNAAPVGSYPGFAYWNQGCGATLIAPQIALTAAHCYLGSPGTLFLGSTFRQRGEEFAVDHVRIHPFYNGNRDDPDWDFMILKLVEEVPASTATPVTLNTNADLPFIKGDALVAVGFGRLEEGAKSDSDTLQEVTLPYVPNEDCSVSYGFDRISETAVCAGSAGYDACQGDSGGPLFYGNQPDMQIGIVSWGLGCARPNYPGVYARISTGYPWIQAQACLEADNPPDGFCDGAAVSIDKSLQVDMVLDPLLYKNYSWGLYNVANRTTLYESKEEHGIVKEIINTATSTGSSITESVSSSRKEEDEEQPQQEVLPPNAIRLQWDNVAPGTYYFTMKNPLGSGLASANSKAWIEQGGRRSVVTVPHNFGSDFTKYFTVSDRQLVTEIRKQQLAFDPAPVTVEMMLDVFYDANPEETAWELRNLSTNEVLAFISVGSITESNYQSYTYTVQRGQQYQVRIWDNAGNGMTNGWMSVWVGHTLAWKSDVDTATAAFTHEATKVIDVV